MNPRSRSPLHSAVGFGTPPAVLIVDRDGLIRHASRNAGALLSRRAAELPGWRLHEVVADGVGRVNEILAACPARGPAILTSLMFRRWGGRPPFKRIVRVSRERGGAKGAVRCRLEIHEPREEHPPSR